MLISYKLNYAKIIDHGQQKIFARPNYRLIPAICSSDHVKISLNHSFQRIFRSPLGDLSLQFLCNFVDRTTSKNRVPSSCCRLFTIYSNPLIFPAGNVNRVLTC
jgi:hypothetical protein